MKTNIGFQIMLLNESNICFPYLSTIYTIEFLEEITNSTNRCNSSSFDEYLFSKARLNKDQDSFDVGKQYALIRTAHKRINDLIVLYTSSCEADCDIDCSYQHLYMKYFRYVIRCLR